MALTYEELTTGPLALEIAAFIEEGNDEAICESFNRKDITVHGGITTSTIRQYLMLNNFLLLIESGTSETCRIVARALELFPNFDLSQPIIFDKFSLILDALVGDDSVAGFDELNKIALISEADKKISRAEQLGLVIDSDSIAQILRG